MQQDLKAELAIPFLPLTLFVHKGHVIPLLQLLLIV